MVLWSSGLRQQPAKLPMREYASAGSNPANAAIMDRWSSGLRQQS